MAGANLHTERLLERNCKNLLFKSVKWSGNPCPNVFSYQSLNDFEKVRQQYVSQLPHVFDWSRANVMGFTNVCKIHPTCNRLPQNWFEVDGGDDTLATKTDNLGSEYGTTDFVVRVSS